MTDNILYEKPQECPHRYTVDTKDGQECRDCGQVWIAVELVKHIQEENQQLRAENKRLRGALIYEQEHSMMYEGYDEDDERVERIGKALTNTKPEGEKNDGRE